MKSLCLNS